MHFITPIRNEPTPHTTPYSASVMHAWTTRNISYQIVAWAALWSFLSHEIAQYLILKHLHREGDIWFVITLVDTLLKGGSWRKRTHEQNNSIPHISSQIFPVLLKRSLRWTGPSVLRCLLDYWNKTKQNEKRVKTWWIKKHKRHQAEGKRSIHNSESLYWCHMPMVMMSHETVASCSVCCSELCLQV